MVKWDALIVVQDHIMARCKVPTVYVRTVQSDV